MDWYVTTLKLTVVALVAWFVSLPMVLLLLLVASIADWVTGLVAAGYRGKISSWDGYWGAMRKGAQFHLVLFIRWVEVSSKLSLPTPPEYAWLSPHLTFYGVVAAWLLVNEFWSILENLDRIGVRMPRFLVLAMKTLRTRMGPSAEHSDFGV